MRLVLREGNLSTAQESCEKNINIKDAKLVTKVDQNQVTKICNEPGKIKQTADHSKQTMPEASLNVPWHQ